MSVFNKVLVNFKKFWHFVWYGEGFISWFCCLIVSFILIKFLVYPFLGFVFGTSYPIVAVVSGSMEHNSDFDDWWNRKTCQSNGFFSQGEFYENLGVSRGIFESFNFVNGFNKGDLMVLFGAKSVSLGDVIVFSVSHRPDPIIHRVIEINGKVFKTKGDNNCAIAGFEQNIPEDALVGKAVLRIPYLGWLKLAFVNLINLVV